MKPRLVAIGLVATLSVLSGQRTARADAGADSAAEAAAEAGKDTAPPVDTGTPDAETPDGSAPAETGPGPDGGQFSDVIIADGGEADANPPPSTMPLPPSDDAGVNATGGSGGCAISTLSYDDRLSGGLALVLGTLFIGVSRGVRRRRR